MSRRQRTTSNHGTVEQIVKYEDDLTEEYATIEERTAYCDTLDGKMKGNVCHYTKTFTEEFMFDYVYRQGQILEINGVSTTASMTKIKSDKDFEFQENDTIYSKGAKLGKIEGTPEIKFLNEKANRRRGYIPKMWYMNIS